MHQQPPTAPPAPCAPATKHAELSNAIDGFDVVAAQLDNLLARIVGSNPDEGAAPPILATAPSLAEVLDHGADRMRCKAETAHNLIDKITAQLF